MILKGWETIIGAEMRVGRTSPPHIDTGESEVRFMSGERLLESREEGSRRKEWACQEDTGVKGIPFEMGCFLITVSLLQVYFVLTSWTSQGLYLHWAELVQHLISNLSSSLLKYKFNTSFIKSNFFNSALPL